MSEDEEKRSIESGFSIEYADETEESTSAANYKSRIQGVYPIRLPQSKAVFKAKLLGQESANMLTLALGALPRSGTGGFSKKAFAELSRIADEYLPKIITSPTVVRPPKEGETPPPEALTTREISASDMIAILTWGSTGQVPDYEALSSMSSFQQE